MSIYQVPKARVMNKWDISKLKSMMILPDISQMSPKIEFENSRVGDKSVPTLLNNQHTPCYTLEAAQIMQLIAFEVHVK